MVDFIWFLSFPTFISKFLSHLHSPLQLQSDRCKTNEGFRHKRVFSYSWAWSTNSFHKCTSLVGGLGMAAPLAYISGVNLGIWTKPSKLKK